MAKILVSKARPGLPWAARRAGDDYGARDKPDWRDVDWRPHLHQLEISGRSVNYVDYGTNTLYGIEHRDRTHKLAYAALARS